MGARKKTAGKKADSVKTREKEVNKSIREDAARKKDSKAVKSK